MINIQSRGLKPVSRPRKSLTLQITNSGMGSAERLPKDPLLLPFVLQKIGRACAHGTGS